MPDYTVSGTAADNQIRFFAATTKDLTQHAQEIHGASPAVTVALGRLLTAGSLMGAMLKNDDELLTLQIKGDGPIGGMTVTAFPDGSVKGFAFNPKADSDDPLKTAQIIGDGTLQIIKDIGLREPYVGTSPLVSGEIAEDLTYYYAKSEQTPTSVALGLTLDDDGRVAAAGGFIIQLMPDCDDAVIDQLEARLSHSRSVTDLLAAGQSPEMIIEDLLGDMGLCFTGKADTQFKCNCSRDRVTRALISIGKKEIADMIAEGEPIEMKCDFCNTAYTYEVPELQILLNEMNKKEMQRFNIVDAQ
ncbi:MAG: Hsp33 family molecular chaperone HslO [Eubacterium sp.]|nr:Hsp33 family molecular chaperone HslO [Eubacterium sp.]